MGFLAVVWADSGGAARGMIVSMPPISRYLRGLRERHALATAADCLIGGVLAHSGKFIFRKNAL